MKIKYSFLILGSLLAANTLVAQDTVRKKTIEITSTFKPVIKEAAKINLNATPPAADGRRVVQDYQVPAQNLYFTYKPSPLQPVAMQADSGSAWLNSNYIKLGAGNTIIPYIQSGFSFGDRKTTFYNFFANHHSAKGKLPFQKNSNTDVTGSVTYKTPGHLEWTGKLGFKSDQYFLYGYDPSISQAFTKDQLRQQFQTFGGKINLRNAEPTAFGLNYEPSLKISFFSGKNDINKATEANTVLNIPMEKSINEDFYVKLGITADLTNYRPDGQDKIQNNLYSIAPSVMYVGNKFTINAGVAPTWQNKDFKFLPNITADITTNNQYFTIQLGWIGYYEKGSYERLASINPWLAQPVGLLNTKVEEIYGGFKGSIQNHFTYSAKLGFNTFRDRPLFANDLTDGKTFDIIYTPLMRSLMVHGEIGYIKGEDFTAKAHLTYNQFDMKNNELAYGLLPFETGVTLRWKAIKNLWINADADAWSGADYRTPSHTFGKRKGAFDLSAGLEYKVARQVNVWFQMNNILNNKYERWNQYQVYGFNVLGGIVFSFNQK